MRCNWRNIHNIARLNCYQIMRTRWSFSFYFSFQHSSSVSLRCVALSDPLKESSRSQESWNSFLTKLRTLLLMSFTKNLGRFEDDMRTLREKRTEPGWSFCDYFMVQVRPCYGCSFSQLHLNFTQQKDVTFKSIPLINLRLLCIHATLITYGRIAFFFPK